MTDTRPNVIIIHADQLRGDCLGCNGNSVIKTPHLDRLAAQGTRFAQAFSQHPQCVPSRSSMLTGRYPHACGAISNHTAMSENETTLGERFIAAGYRSIGVDRKSVV